MGYGCGCRGPETGAEVDEPPETGQVPDTMDTTGEIVVDEPDGMFDAVEAALSGDGSPVSEILRHI